MKNNFYLNKDEIKKDLGISKKELMKSLERRLTKFIPVRIKNIDITPLKKPPSWTRVIELGTHGTIYKAYLYYAKEIERVPSNLILKKYPQNNDGNRRYKIENSILLGGNKFAPKDSYNSLGRILQCFPTCYFDHDDKLHKNRIFPLELIDEKTLDELVKTLIEGKEYESVGSSIINLANDPVLVLHDRLASFKKAIEKHLGEPLEKINPEKRTKRFFAALKSLTKQGWLSGAEEKLKKAYSSLAERDSQEKYMTLVQYNGFSNHNMLISLVDGAEIVIGSRGWHLGLLYGCPRIFNYLKNPKEETIKKLAENYLERGKSFVEELKKKKKGPREELKIHYNNLTSIDPKELQELILFDAINGNILAARATIKYKIPNYSEEEFLRAAGEQAELLEKMGVPEARDLRKGLEGIKLFPRKNRNKNKKIKNNRKKVLV